MSLVHIYTAAHQPATRFRVDVSPDISKERWLWIRNGKHKLIHATCCRKRRWAENLTVQVFYDSIRYWCRKGKGCKHDH